jgi:DNA-binding protein H-NS
MEVDELWSLHERLTRILSDRIAEEKVKLERRLAQLNGVDPADVPGGNQKPDSTPRRKYPKVLPKYCNPLVPTETWSGRGKQPRWLVAALKAGQKLENFKIEEPKQPAEN